MPRAKKIANTASSSEYMSNGVIISPSIPSPGDEITVMYDGILSKSGANHIFAHIGYGSMWDDRAYYRMEKTTTGFEASVSVSEADTMNICFKDCANNWDNNSGKNYSFDISK
ncbi:MAG: carbohydrate-binding protein [Clostridia bacterium]|nr:carbohydrate-binding protein [Clostridia bacterium]